MKLYLRKSCKFCRKYNADTKQCTLRREKRNFSDVCMLFEGTVYFLQNKPKERTFVPKNTMYDIFAFWRANPDTTQKQLHEKYKVSIANIRKIIELGLKKQLNK
jgi:predicted HTH transcriptional regulator